MNQVNEFCKIFIVENNQLLFRKGIVIINEEERAVIFMNTVKMNSLSTAYTAIEGAIPCCCISCQEKMFQNINQTHAEALMKSISVTNSTSIFYSKIHNN